MVACAKTSKTVTHRNIHSLPKIGLTLADQTDMNIFRMDFHYKIAVFVIVTIVLAWISWPSLRNIRSHGFFRFFVWESIAVFILVQLQYWFYRPFSPLQIISWLLLLISFLLAILGAVKLHKSGKPDRSRIDPSLIGIEKTTTLVTTGVYGHIRHPLYSSLLLEDGVFFLKHPAISGILFIAFIMFFLTIAARNEEIENIRYYGSAYQDYMNRTKRFIPFLF